MPLDIMPAPAALPGAAPPGPADAPPGGVPVTGSAALLFGLLLAQTVGQVAPETPTAAALTVTSKGEDKKKDKTPAVPLPVSLGALPAPLTPPAASPPKPSRAQAADTTKTTQAAISGKAMDTLPAPGGELLSPQQNTAPLEVDLVPTETGQSALPHVPVPTATPSQSVTATPPGATASLPKALPVAAPVATPSSVPSVRVGPSPAPPHASGLPAAPSASVLPGTSAPPAVAPAELPAVAVATVMAAPPSPKNAVVGAAPSTPLPAGLQNGTPIADNQPVKNAGGKSDSPPAPVAKETARVAVTAPTARRAPAAGEATGQQPSQDRPAPSVGHEARAADTPAPPQQAAPTPSQSPTVTPMPPADRTRMLAQVTHSLEVMTPKVGVTGRQQVTLQLHPQDWGHLKVRVTMTPTTGADGRVSTQVTAHVIAEHPAVKAALETGQTELRHALREAGLHLDRLTITVQAPAAGSEASAGNSRQESRSEGWGGGQSVPSGTTAQGGSNPGGRHPAPSAAFAQGRTGHATTHTRGTGQEDVTVPISTAAIGRVDTRA